MLSVTITEKDGPSSTTTFDKAEVLIGRVKGNDIVLPKTNVSKRHSRIVVKDNKIILIDLKSTNGTFVNGRKITGPQVITESDRVFIGDFTLEMKEIGGAPMGMPPVQQPSLGMVPPQQPSLGMIPAQQPSLSMAPAVPMGMAPAAPMGLSPAAPMGMPSVSQMGVAPAAPQGPSFGAIPSAASLPSVGGISAHANNGMTNHAPAMDNFARPNQLGGPGLAPMAHQPEPIAPAQAPMNQPAAPSLMENNAPMGPGMGMSNAPSLGALPSLGGSSLGAGPSLSGPSLGAGPSLGGPSLGAGPSLGGPSLNAPAPVQPVASPVSQPASMAAPSAQPSSAVSLSPARSALSSLKPASLSPAPAAEDKAIRLPGSNAASLGALASSKPAALTSNRQSGKKEFSAASLPEAMVIDDARTMESENILKAARIVMDKYLNENDFQAISAQVYPPEPDVQDDCYNKLSNCVRQLRASIGNVNPEILLDILLKEACGLGAIDTLIDDADVSAFTIYNFETIIAERKGRREISSYQFTSADTLYLAAQRLLAYQGINPQTAPAISEVRFGDGTQIQVVLPPVSVASTTITVRKPVQEPVDLPALVQNGVISAEMEKFLSLCVKARRNILVVGAQGAGRTSILNALGAVIPDGERIATVENSAVLHLPQIYVMSLEAQNVGFQDGDLASLIRKTSNLRAERVIVDSVQTTDDAMAFVNAICSGAQGSMASLCAMTADDGVKLFKRMLSSSSALIGNIDIVVTVRAFSDACRRVVEIAEVVDEDNCIKTVPVFGWQASGMGTMATGEGQFRALGNVPRFCQELEHSGAVDLSIFNS